MFASERNESWNIYQVKLERKEEKFFYACTLLKEEVLVATDQETFQPQFSPDGKEVAFLEERVILRVMNLESKKVRTVLDKKYMPIKIKGNIKDADLVMSPTSEEIIT